MVAVVGICGAIAGSFLNVIVHRLARGESIVTPWLVLRGRCRHCSASIPVRYSLVELTTAAVFVAVTLAMGFDEGLLLELPFAAALVAVAAIDFEHRIIPNKVVLPLLAYGLVVATLIDLDAMPERLVAGASGFTFLFVAALAYPAGMGMGDVKLAGVMGVYLGLSVVPGLFAAFLTGTVVGLVIVAREGAGARKKGVPFGPFLALGGLVGLLAGPELSDLYQRLFLSSG